MWRVKMPGVRRGNRLSRRTGPDARARAAIAADGEADEEQVFAASQQLSVQRKDRQDEEQSEHAQAIDAGEARAGAQFGCVHAIGMHGGMRRESEARYSSKFRFFNGFSWTRSEFAAHARTI